MNGNTFVALMVRSPLRALMGNTMLITVTGRKSGKAITTPVNYVEEGDALWVLSSRDRRWWRNVARQTRVRLYLNGRETEALAEIVDAPEDVVSRLAQYIALFPAAARGLGIRSQDGNPNHDDLVRAASQRLFVRICPS